MRDLLLGSDLTFTDRGTHDLQGVPDQRQVLAIDDHPSAYLDPENGEWRSLAAHLLWE